MQKCSLSSGLSSANVNIFKHWSLNISFVLFFLDSICGALDVMQLLQHEISSLERFRRTVVKLCKNRGKILNSQIFNKGERKNFISRFDCSVPTDPDNGEIYDNKNWSKVLIAIFVKCFEQCLIQCFTETSKLIKQRFGSMSSDTAVGNKQIFNFAPSKVTAAHQELATTKLLSMSSDVSNKNNRPMSACDDHSLNNSIMNYHFVWCVPPACPHGCRSCF